MSEEAIESVDAGSSGGDWRASLGDDIRHDPSLASIQDINGLAKSYVHAQRLVGADKVAIPKEEASADEWNDFYNRLGRPEKYELQRPELNEGLNYDSAMEEKMLGIMHQAGLTQAQANKLYSGYMEHVNGEFGEMSKGREMQQAEWDRQIRNEFGRAYDERVDMAQRAAAEFGGEEFLGWLDESGMGDHPMLVKMFAKIGQQMMEAGVDPQGRGQSFMLTPDAARQEIARLQRDPNFMAQYSDSEKDGHNAAIEKMQQLFGFAYPEQM
jgi:hypothetical protein